MYFGRFLGGKHNRNIKEKHVLIEIIDSSIFDIFQSRASKFEADLLVSYNQKKQTLIYKYKT